MYLQWGRLLADKKTILWALFFVQVCLIGGVLFFGVRGNAEQQQPPHLRTNHDGDNAKPAAAGVQFVHRNDTKTKGEAQSAAAAVVRLVTGGQYEHEFVGKRNCFKVCLNRRMICSENCDSCICLLQDGLARRPAQSPNTTHAEEPANRAHNNLRACVCKPDYHGSDCGQPEVVWRAFMTAKMPLKLAAISRRQPHSIFYLIHLTDAAATTVGSQLETLEIQIMELAHVVDVFVLCGTGGELQSAVHDGPLKPLAHKVLILPDSSADGSCSPRNMYARFRQYFAAADATQNASSTPATVVRTDDVLLVSGADEILNWRAVKYFKWYDHWPQPVQFRLKYLVYGYYWQHPQSTWLAGGAAQLSVLEEVHRADPRRLVAATKPGMIVGDLNHVGGWFCQYCCHPLNVARRLVADRVPAPASQPSAKRGAAGKGAQWSGGRVEQLIANGLFVDGKLGLTRLHRFADKYYAPECVRNASWRYEGVLSNVYATYDDDDEYSK